MREVELPTLEQLGQFQMDCEDPNCQLAAEQWAEYCGHSPTICHQRIEQVIDEWEVHNFFQLVIHHGGEAVLIIPWDCGLNAPVYNVYEWFNRIHEYEAQRLTPESRRDYPEPAP